MKLTLNRLVIAITFIALFAMAVRVSVDTDTWWHLRAGQWIVEHGTLPQTDPFSHTRAGAEWKVPAWIVQVPMYWLYTYFGYAGLNLFTALLVTLTFVFIYRTCVGHPFLRAFTLVLAAAVSAIYWSARPQIVSFLLAGVFVYILWLYRWRNINRLWVLVPLMTLWANAHGGFAIGFILLGLTWLGQALSLFWWWFNKWVLNEPIDMAPGDVNWRGLLWLTGTGLACALAVMLNPAGPAMLLYPFKTVSMTVLQDFIQEWQSPNFHMREAQPFLWLLFATLAAVGFSRRRINLTDLLLVSGVAYTGFLAGRNVAVFAVVAPPVLTHHLVALWEDLRERYPRWTQFVRIAPGLSRGRAIINWSVLALVVVAAAVKVYIPLQPEINEAQTRRILSVDAAAYVRAHHPAGQLFNSYNFGAYLTWALYPDYPVYVDGRTDLYNDDFLREYINVIMGRPGYATTLDKYGVNLVLVEANTLLGDRLNEDNQWRKTYSDDVAAVYERTPALP